MFGDLCLVLSVLMYSLCVYVCMCVCVCVYVHVFVCGCGGQKTDKQVEKIGLTKIEPQAPLLVVPIHPFPSWIE